MPEDESGRGHRVEGADTSTPSRTTLDDSTCPAAEPAFRSGRGAWEFKPTSTQAMIRRSGAKLALKLEGPRESSVAERRKSIRLKLTNTGQRQRGETLYSADGRRRRATTCPPRTKVGLAAGRRRENLWTSS